ncbi:twin-arginine translocation signal domain-containing protein [Archangium lipolyticum]|uniref:twin-arginine translocation signal domain-containing protein n=1 Tax=Archangium lipolyticum TaxID=2970465 RepID=UPI002149A0CA|nr:twin-arginine translocation signal domain-containing protein [Archangium lipolyticum]
MTVRNDSKRINAVRTEVSRRSFLGGSLATAGGLALGGGTGLVSGLAHAAPAGFPNYTYIGTPFNKVNLRYNPTGELIFPCIRGTIGRVANPLARYYLYYAPHDAPGGICLAYGDHLDGQFTEYPYNPIFSRTWPGGPPDISHVSSPHVLWNSRVNQFYLYFHGENTVTRVATSTDGIHFTYQGGCVSTRFFTDGSVSETSYARVFEHDIPSKGSHYVMVFMGNQNGRRRIFWGWSATGDAQSWSIQQRPLISPSADGETDISGPHVVFRNGTAYVIYHGASGRMYITEVGLNFDKEIHLGVFHTPLGGWPDNGRAAAPSFGTENGVEYMFYEAGPRLDATIAVAKVLW